MSQRYLIFLPTILWTLFACGQCSIAQTAQTKGQISPLNLVGRYLDTVTISNVPAIILEVKPGGIYSAEFAATPNMPTPVLQQGTWRWDEKWHMLRLNTTNSTGRLLTYYGEPWVFGTVEVEKGNTNELHFGSVVLKRGPK